jgi:7,8-didemethyl-8-hydroxy-5-deazariboflavin synthase CofG subunit
MNPFELKKLAEICAIVKIMLDSVDTKNQAEFYNSSPGKRLEIRLKSISWAAKLQMPVATGFMIGAGETQTHRKEILQEIVKIHTEYNNIHEVLLQNFVPVPHTPMAHVAPPTKETMLKAVEQALEILPSDIKVIVPLELNPDFADFIRAGIRDLGRIYIGNNEIFSNHKSPNITDVEATIQTLGFKPQQRFPLRLDYIKNGRYSKKLGQVFDAYRYKIKKEEQEKLKDAKLNAHENKR